MTVRAAGYGRRMGPRQNRVTPTGEIVAIPLRGSWLGNRGILHDASGRVVRHHASNLWITCALSFKDWRLPQWQPHHFTVLFFHDEAVSFAAGHRPCALCRREAYDAYRNAIADHDGGHRCPPRRSTNVSTASAWFRERGDGSSTRRAGPTFRWVRSSCRTATPTSSTTGCWSGGRPAGMRSLADGRGSGRRWCSPRQPAWPRCGRGTERRRRSDRVRVRSGSGQG
jgi:hypothetical protein